MFSSGGKCGRWLPGDTSVRAPVKEQLKLSKHFWTTPHPNAIALEVRISAYMFREETYILKISLGKVKTCLLRSLHLYLWLMELVTVRKEISGYFHFYLKLTQKLLGNALKRLSRDYFYKLKDTTMAIPLTSLPNSGYCLVWEWVTIN